MEFFFLVYFEVIGFSFLDENKLFLIGLYLDEFFNIFGNGLYLFILIMLIYCIFLNLGFSGV